MPAGRIDGVQPARGDVFRELPEAEDDGLFWSLGPETNRQFPKRHAIMLVTVIVPSKKEAEMPYFVNPSVTNQRVVLERGKVVLIADTTVELDCCNPRFSRWARDVVEREQDFIARRYGYDEVRLVQV